MNTMTEPPPEPLFSLDLKDNGGLLAPASLAAVNTWIEGELSFWSWLRRIRVGGAHHQGIMHALGQLDQAQHSVNEARQHKESDPQHYQNQLKLVRSHLEDVFIRQRLPHSSTPQAMRIEGFREEAGDHPASFFASVFVPPQQGHHFNPQELQGWRGLIEGVIERYCLASAPAEGRGQAADRSFEQLRAKAEALLGEKKTAYDALHREFSTLEISIKRMADQQKDVFDEAQAARVSDFEKLVDAHKQEMETLRRTYEEAIALRAPVSYWAEKRRSHTTQAKWTGGLSFAGIGATALGLGWTIHDLIRSTGTTAAPEPWRIALLVLVGIFAVWGVRLIVRMFLSHLHLATDAAERMVMTQTYLSLLDGRHLPKDEDRKLILQALFRPTSDGLVKDEAIPPSIFEFLTRQSKT
jgi:hypothetical protein